MTFEEMQEIAKKVADALNAHPEFEDAYLMESTVAGEPLPIVFIHGDGDLIVSLDVI